MKEWYILVQGKQEGPYNTSELKEHPSVTPDTLVWRQGLAEWIVIRDVPELKEIFEDKPESKPIEDLIPPRPTLVDLDQDQGTLALQNDPFQFFMWMIIIALIIIYTLFMLYRNVR